MLDKDGSELGDSDGMLLGMLDKDGSKLGDDDGTLLGAADLGAFQDTSVLPMSKR